VLLESDKKTVSSDNIVAQVIARWQQTYLF